MCRYNVKIFILFTFSGSHWKIYNPTEARIDESITVWSILIIINNTILPLNRISIKAYSSKQFYFNKKKRAFVPWIINPLGAKKQIILVPEVPCQKNNQWNQVWLSYFTFPTGTFHKKITWLYFITENEK